MLLWSFIFISHLILLAHSCWQQHLSFKTGYLPLSLCISYVTFPLAIILIFKHAAILCLSGISAELALTQAESNYHQANIASKVQQQFTASYEEYSTEQFVDFLMDTNIGLFSLSSIKIIADAAFRVINTTQIENPYAKKGFCGVSLYLCLLNCSNLSQDFIPMLLPTAAQTPQ